MQRQVSPQDDWEEIAKVYAANQLGSSGGTTEDTDVSMLTCSASLGDGTNDGIAGNAPVEKISKEELELENMRMEVRLNPLDFNAIETLAKTIAAKKDREEELEKVYEQLLDTFPLCFGYWKRLASLHLKRHSLATAEQDYRKALIHLCHNPEMWRSYAEALQKANVDLEHIREVIDEAIHKCGIHWNSYGMWCRAIDIELEVFATYSGETGEPLQENRTTATLRLKKIFFKLLSTPTEKLNDAWDKFKCLVGQGDAEPPALTISITDLLVDDEILQFATKMAGKDDDDSSEARLKQELEKETNCLTVRYSEGIILKCPHLNGDSTIQEVLDAACGNAKRPFVGDKTQVKLVSEGKLRGAPEERNKTLNELGLNAKRQLLFFDGAVAIKKRAESYGSQNAVEKWCLEIREELYKKTLEEYKKRLPFEERVVRWFFHPDPLKCEQVNAWREYLDFEEAQGDQERERFLYERSLEVCCNYPEYWCRRVKRLERLGRIKEAGEVHRRACFCILKLRPDMYLEYAEFAEKHGYIETATNLLQRVIGLDSGIAPELLEGWSRMIGLQRRTKHFKECEELFELANTQFKENMSARCVLAMEKAIYLKTCKNDALASIGVLRDEWETQRSNTVLLKLYLEFARHDLPYADVKNIFLVALADSEMSVPDQWAIWVVFVTFAQRHSPSAKDIVDIKDMAQEFLFAHKKELTDRLVPLKVRRKRSEKSSTDGQAKRRKLDPLQMATGENYGQQCDPAYSYSYGDPYGMAAYNYYYSGYYQQGNGYAHTGSTDPSANSVVALPDN